VDVSAIRAALRCDHGGCPCRRERGLLHCPSHADAKPSLGVGQGQHAEVVVHCYAGCDQQAVIAALREHQLWPERERRNGHEHATQEWPLYDTDGTLVATHVRLNQTDGRKLYPWRLPNATTWGLRGRKAATLPLYGAHELADWPDGATVLVVEGEKARDALASLGVRAVGTVTGAQGTPAAAVLESIARFAIMRWADNDPPGEAHMDRIAAQLHALGIASRRLHWPDAPPKGDAADFVAGGGTPEALTALLTAPAETPVPEPNGRTAERPNTSSAVLPFVLSTDIPPADSDPAEGLWGPFLPDEPSVVLLSAETSAGKTTWGYNLARALASGEAYLGLTPTRPVKVWYLDLETPEHLRRAMLDSIGRHERWAFCTPLVSLEQPVVQQALVATLRDWGAEVLVVDTLSAAWPVQDEDDNAEANRQLDGFRQLAHATQTRVLLFHHQGQGNPKAKFRARGATARVDRPDVALNLDEIDNDVRQLSIVKSRYGTRGQSITFRFAADLGFELIPGDDEASPSAYAAASARVIDVVTRRVSRQDLGQLLPTMPPRTLNEVLTRLVRARKLDRCGADGQKGRGFYQPSGLNGREADNISGRSAVLPFGPESASRSHSQNGEDEDDDGWEEELL
jgi:hypothetical protein